MSSSSRDGAGVPGGPPKAEPGAGSAGRGAAGAALWLLRRYIAPQPGTVPLGKLTTPMIRGWRAGLLADGVSDSMAAKSYRLLRAVLTTAVEEDKIIPRNPCKIRGAGKEHAAERPVLTVAQVFDLAECVGCRPVGNIRKLDGGG
jgi:hypothetical protein